LNGQEVFMRLSWALVILVGALSAFLTGCQKPVAAPPTISSNLRPSPKGFEIRYNAVIALARRGSEHTLDEAPLEVLQEMLDEEQQQVNFKVRLRDGQEVPEDKATPDPVAAQTAVVSALQAVIELHKKRPELNLSKLEPAIQKLQGSSNELIKQETKRTWIALGKS
jgi:hypothetical protein